MGITVPEGVTSTTSTGMSKNEQKKYHTSTCHSLHRGIRKLKETIASPGQVAQHLHDEQFEKVLPEA